VANCVFCEVWTEFCILFMLEMVNGMSAVSLLKEYLASRSFV
jgi:hypothetical protein